MSCSLQSSAISFWYILHSTLDVNRCEENCIVIVLIFYRIMLLILFNVEKLFFNKRKKKIFFNLIMIFIFKSEFLTCIVLLFQFWKIGVTFLYVQLNCTCACCCYLLGFVNFSPVVTWWEPQGLHGLGIMIIEGKHAEVGQGIFISDIQENSAAEQVSRPYLLIENAAIYKEWNLLCCQQLVHENSIACDILCLLCNLPGFDTF